VIYKEEKTELGESLMQTLSASTIDRGVDTFQAFINELLEDTTKEVFGQLPIAKTVVALRKAGLAIRDYFFIKKIFLFVAGFQSADNDLKEKHKKAISDPKSRREMGEHLVYTLDLLDQLSKSEALFKIYSAYLKQEINHREFLSYSYTLNKIDMNSIELLKNFYLLTKEREITKEPNTFDVAGHINDYVLNNFAFAGLLAIGGQGLVMGCFVGFSPNPYGEKFLKILGL